jgi:hypothetical protein
MSEFLLSYRVPGHVEPGGAALREAWSAWFDSLGAHLVERGNPVFESATIGSGPTETRLGGYSVIEAAGLEAAVEIARGCPGLPTGFGVEVGLLAPVNDRLSARRADRP